MAEGKYIHYCWFGGKPLSKLAKDCIESWKLFLPDYEIICWDEKNADLNDCAFVKEAYEAKSYAFVADYVRTKALYDMGGIYFDTDMKIIKDPTELIGQNTSFLGVEDTGNVSCGVWYEEQKHSFLTSKLLERYRKFDGFDFERRAEFSIPLLLTDILKGCGFDYRKRRIQQLEHQITIYPREYFYPYSYNWNNNLFTDNTYMIHYYDASWLPIKNRIENTLVRRLGRIPAIKLIRAYQKTTNYSLKTLKVLLYPAVLYRRRRKEMRRITPEYLANLDKTIAQIEKNKKTPYLVLHNGEWLGVSSATKELFRHNIDCRELYRNEDIKRVARAIVSTEAQQAVFSAVCEGWPKLMKELHALNPKIKLKVFWHGSMSQVLDEYGWRMHGEVMKLCKSGIVEAFATCKESLYNFYLEQGVNAYFITNVVKGRVIGDPKKSKGGGANWIRVGIYAVNPNNWRKNVFSQIAAVSLLEDVVLDVAPLDSVVEDFAKQLGVKIEGVANNISREEMFERISLNDINLYVTFSECAPMLPLESLEVGVPCLTGNNHHYFENTELEQYLVIDNETDIMLIKKKIEGCLKNRKKIMKLYQKMKADNLRAAKRDVKAFLEA